MTWRSLPHCIRLGTSCSINRRTQTQKHLHRLSTLATSGKEHSAHYVTSIASSVSQLLLLDTTEPEHLCALLYSECKTQGALKAFKGTLLSIEPVGLMGCVCVCWGGVGVWWRDTGIDKYQQCNYTPDTFAGSTCASLPSIPPLQSQASDWPPGTMCMCVRWSVN